MLVKSGRSHSVLGARASGPHAPAAEPPEYKAQCGETAVRAQLCATAEDWRQGRAPEALAPKAAALRSTEFLALVIEGAVQPFAKTIIAFILLRREKTEKRGLTWNGLLLKCD
jgi:hypothetical protein